MQRAERLGLLGDIAGENVIQGQETALSRQLRAGMLQRARETYDVGRLWTALEWFEEFMREDIHQYLGITTGIDVSQIFPVKLFSQFFCVGQISIVGQRNTMWGICVEWLGFSTR